MVPVRDTGIVNTEGHVFHNRLADASRTSPNLAAVVAAL